MKDKTKESNKTVNIYYAGFKRRVGGVNNHVINLRKGLLELNHEVKVVTLESLPVFLRYIPHFIQKIGNLVNYPYGFLYKQKVIKFLYKFYYSNSSDVEIFEDIYTYWESNVQSIVVLHALWSDNLQGSDIAEGKRKQLEKKEATIINKIKSNIITVSDPYKEFILSRLIPLGLTKNIQVVELGIDVEKFSQVDSECKSFIYVGAIEARKNIKFLLDVFNELKDMDDYQLTIVGEGPQKNEMIAYVLNNKIRHVNFLGKLGYEDVVVELPKHKYYLHTSTKESFSYSLLEAKLSGLITIAYKGLEVPNDFIDIKVGSFKVKEWVDKIVNNNETKNLIDMKKYSYSFMTLNTLNKLI